MIDRRLVGILTMAAIASSSLSILLFARTAEEDIRMVKNHWDTLTLEGWRQLPLSERAVPYTLGLVARKPLGEVSIRFGVLRNQTFRANYTGWEDLTPKEKAVRIGNLAFLDSRAQDVSESMDVAPMEQWADVALRDRRARVLVLDYHPFLAALADPGLVIGLPCLFAFVFDDSGNISQFYSGYWDFFQARATSVLDLTIQLNDNATRYANQQNMVEGSLPLSMTTQMGGEVIFRDLRKDDRMFVTFRVNGGAVPGLEALMQIIRLQVDGEYLDPTVNILRR